MTTVRLALAAPHPAQAKVIQEARRFNTVCCGRRWGKTKLGMDRLIHPALKGRATAWFAPTYRQLSDAWRDLQEILLPITTRKSESEHRLELRGRGYVEMWSLDNPDAGRGRAYSAVVIDEAALVPGLEQIWSQSLRPMLSDFKGEAWFLSTPRGVSNYFHVLFQRGQDILHPAWASWRFPTSANPYIDPQEIRAAQEDLSELAFAQEYLAAFVTWTGAVFRNLLDAVTAPALTPSGHSVIGADWGRSASGDYTVFCVADQCGQVLALDRFRGLEYSLQMTRLKALYEKYRPDTVVAESNNMGQPVIEALQRDGLRVRPFVTSNASKARAIEALALAFERGRIRIPNDPVLLGELQAFESTQLPSGLSRYAAPEGLHDDAVMALALAWSYISGQTGTGILGLIEYQKQEAALLTTPSRPAPPDTCPQCGSGLVGKLPQGFRCNACGHQFGGQPVVNPAATRREVLADADDAGSAFLRDFSRRFPPERSSPFLADFFHRFRQ